MEEQARILHTSCGRSERVVVSGDHAALAAGDDLVPVEREGRSVAERARAAAAHGCAVGFRRVFQADPNIGGRYSVLSYFGLVPAALAGVPLKGVLESAIGAAESCRLIDGNPGLLLGEKLGELSLAGRDKLTFIVDAPIDNYGIWVEQLIAESTGKHGKGVLPVAGEPITVPELAGEYGIDRVFVHIADAANPDEENAATVDALEERGQPVFRMTSGGPDDLGRFG